MNARDTDHPSGSVAPYVVALDSSIQEAISAMDGNAKAFAMVLDSDRRLIDTITDGDVRRAMLDGITLEEVVSALLEHKQADKTYSAPYAARVGTSDATLLHEMTARSLRHIPLIDENGRVVDLAVLNDLVKDYRPTPTAVVMAGGLGRRLLPLTSETPKPMLPVGGRPLLEHIVFQLRAAGIKRVAITTHFRHQMIERHFGDGSLFGIDLEYMHEGEPLGTAGGLAALANTGERVLVINGDVLTAVNFRAMLEFHEDHEAIMTVAVRQLEIPIPFGVVDTEAERILRLREKPTASYLANAGIYVLEPTAYGFVTPGDQCDMTDLMQMLIESSQRVVAFPVREYWADIGEPASYRQVQLDHDAGELSR
jgi:dTDP-glucose pyrophosphorylase/CBS domain-containing protein